MGEPESIRQIARNLLNDYLERKVLTSTEYCLEIPADVQAAMDVLDTPRFNGIDREWLRKMGVES